MTFLPYGRQSIDDDDIAAVVDVLRGDYLTTGPAVAAFEEAVAAKTGARFGCAVSSGTAGLHILLLAAGIGPGDEVVVPPITFAATANAVLYVGALPVFADVRPDTLNIDPERVAEKITPRTKAIVAVDFTGNPADYDALRSLADRHGLLLLADAAHALGATYHGRPVGSLAAMTVFSTHPVKHIATGEGGVVVTDDPELAARLKRFRSHGITTDARQRESAGAWFYEMTDLGFNYRLPDINAALGRSQLRKLDAFVARRRALAARYDALLADHPFLTPLGRTPGASSSFHIYVVRVGESYDRNAVFARLRAAGIGANVHYIPVHLHPYYREHLGTGPGLCPVAEAAYERILTLPLFPAMADADVDRVIEAAGEKAAQASSASATLATTTTTHATAHARRIIIIQARMTSTRLPGKVLMDLGGKPLLKRQIERLRLCREADEIIVATTINAEDDPIVALCDRLGVRCFRGSEHDVLERYVQAARAAHAEIVVRVTSDCPLIDPAETDRVIAALARNRDTADWASNCLERHLPRGLDTEAIWMDALERAHRMASSRPAREHVTYFLEEERPELFPALAVRTDDAQDNSDLRWTVDTEDDLALIRHLFADLHLGTRTELGWRTIADYARHHPEITALNAHIVQKAA